MSKKTTIQALYEAVMEKTEVIESGENNKDLLNFALSHCKTCNKDKKSEIIKAQGDTLEIYIYGEIGGGGFADFTAMDLLEALKSQSFESIDVHIKSPGGNVFEGFAIYNILDQLPVPIATYNDGAALSIASYIFLAGDQRITAENAFFMAHWPWTMAVGNAQELRKEADQLETVGEVMLNTYENKADDAVSESNIRTLLDDGTLLTAQETLDYGFATTIAGNDILTMQANWIDDALDSYIQEMRAQLKRQAQTYTVPLGPYDMRIETLSKTLQGKAIGNQGKLNVKYRGLRRIGPNTVIGAKAN